MEVIPAVDIKGGRCVRLYQGDYKQETVFSEDPVAVAVKWHSMGATRLHIVDLDGAASGKPDNIAIVQKIARSIPIPIQVGGGIRDESTVKKLLNIGVTRVILGTVAIEKPDLIRTLCQNYGDAIIIGIDARDGYVATRGWLKKTTVTAIDLARQMVDIGAKRILYTDIKRDGTLTEPGFDAISELINNIRLPVIAAGGVSAISHIRKLKELGAEGAIVGKAIYTGNLDLKEALAIQKEK